MTPAEFAAYAGPYANQAASVLGIPASAILAQWALESGWGTSHLAREHNNLGGIKRVPESAGGATPADPSSGFAAYPSLAGFGSDYVRVLQIRAHGYPAVLAAGAATYPTARARAEAVIRAMAASDYDAAHYGGTGANVLAVLAQLWPVVGESGALAAGGYAVTPAGADYTVSGPGLSAGLLLGVLLLAGGLAILIGPGRESGD